MCIHIAVAATNAVPTNIIPTYKLLPFSAFGILICFTHQMKIGGGWLVKVRVDHCLWKIMPLAVSKTLLQLLVAVPANTS